MKSLVLFDFDGTIADSMQLGLLLYNNHAAEWKLPQIRPEDIPALREKSYREIITEFKIPVWKIPKMIKVLLGELNAQIDKVPLFPGIKEAIEQIKEKGYKVGILSSNNRPNIVKFLDSKQMEFDYLHTDTNLFGKGNALSSFLRYNGFKPEEVLYVGDEVRDIEACRKNKVEIVSVGWGNNSKAALAKNSPDHLIESPAELLSLI